MLKKFLQIVSALALLSFGASLAQAQTVTLTPSVTSGNGSLATTLTWSTNPAASGCVASGHSSWTGNKAASGTQALPAITLSGTYNLTLTCSWAGDTTATVRWTPPTTNTDGSALAVCPLPTPTSGNCLAGYRVFRRVGSTDMNGAEVTPVDGGAVTSRTFTGLGAGVHNFGVEAVNASGVPSVMSNLAAKTITSTVSRTESVTVTVNPKPSPLVISIE